MTSKDLLIQKEKSVQDELKLLKDKIVAFKTKCANGAYLNGQQKKEPSKDDE